MTKAYPIVDLTVVDGHIAIAEPRFNQKHNFPIRQLQDGAGFLFKRKRNETDNAFQTRYDALRGTISYYVRNHDIDVRCKRIDRNTILVGRVA